MIEKKGNVLQSKADYILVTCNSTVTTRGTLVMGRGAARELNLVRPGIDYIFGQLVLRGREVEPDYGMILLPGAYRLNNTVSYLGIFQVKRFWGDAADLQLISHSSRKLSSYTRVTPAKRWAMNFPGIGNGRLEKADVLPLLQDLPDNVELYTL